MYSHGQSQRLSIWSVWQRKNKNSTSPRQRCGIWTWPMVRQISVIPGYCRVRPLRHPARTHPTFSVDATDQLVAGKVLSGNTAHYCVFLLTSGVLNCRVSKRALFGDRSFPLGNAGGEGEGRPLIDTCDCRQRSPPTKPRALASTSPAPPSHRGAEGGGSGLLLLNTRLHFPGTRLHKLRRPRVGCAGGRWEMR